MGLGIARRSRRRWRPTLAPPWTSPPVSARASASVQSLPLFLSVRRVAVEQGFGFAGEGLQVRLLGPIPFGHLGAQALQKYLGPISMALLVLRHGQEGKI